MANKNVDEHVARVSYWPMYREVDDSQYATLQAYLAEVGLQGGAAEKRMLKDVTRRLNPHLLIERDTGVPIIKKSRQKLKSPITTLLSYFLGLNLEGTESASPDRPVDASDFLNLLKQLRVPSVYLNLIRK